MTERQVLITGGYTGIDSRHVRDFSLKERQSNDWWYLQLSKYRPDKVLSGVSGKSQFSYSGPFAIPLFEEKTDFRLGEVLTKDKRLNRKKCKCYKEGDWPEDYFLVSRPESSKSQRRCYKCYGIISEY